MTIIALSVLGMIQKNLWILQTKPGGKPGKSLLKTVIINLFTVSMCYYQGKYGKGSNKCGLFEIMKKEKLQACYYNIKFMC